MSNKQVEKELKNQNQPEKKKKISSKTPKEMVSQVKSKSSRAGEQVLSEEQEQKGSEKRKKIILCLVLIPIAVLICIYFVFAYQYKDKFFKGTTINGIDCSNLTVEQVEQLLEEQTENYSLAISFRDGKTEILQGQDIGYVYASDGSVQELKECQIPVLWITGYFSDNTYEASAGAEFQEESLREQLFSMEAMQEDRMEAPKDAGIQWKNGKFEIVPEIAGNTLNKEKVLEAVKEGIKKGETQLDIEELGAYAEPVVKQDDENLIRQAEQLTQLVSSSITYTLPSGNQVLDGNVLKDWLVKDEAGNYKKDEESWNQHIRDYVNGLADTVDTLDKDIVFKATGIEPITVPNQVFGWKIDREAEIAQLTSELQNCTVTVREPIYASRAYANENNGIGNTYVEIDLSRQHMWVYENGQLWLETDIVSGKMTHTRYTPAGIYQLYNKETNRRLRGPKQEDGSYEWDVEVKYWMPFNEAIGMHDAWWQYSFGGDNYLYGGSRGCINMPKKEATTLFDWITVGTPVITYYSEEMQFID